MAEPADGPAPGRHVPAWLGRVAHDLRNPVTPMRSAVQLLQLGQLPPELAPELLRTLDRQIDLLLRTIDDVADLARIERGVFALHAAPCDLGQAVAAAAARYARLAGKAAAPVAVDAAPATVWVQADEGRLRQVVEQLCAIVAGPGDTPSAATLQVERDGGDGCVRLVDGGRPLGPDARLEFLAGGEVPADPSALTLGHLVARRILELHGARLGLAAGGTAIELRLPLAPPA
jgi:K+-sensing histidine kinase KdpD